MFILFVLSRQIRGKTRKTVAGSLGSLGPCVVKQKPADMCGLMDGATIIVLGERSKRHIRDACLESSQDEDHLC